MIEMLIVLVIVGVALYAIEQTAVIAPSIKVIIRVVVILLVVIYLLRAFGITDVPLRP
jgi:hypothetical protein